MSIQDLVFFFHFFFQFPLLTSSLVGYFFIGDSTIKRQCDPAHLPQGKCIYATYPTHFPAEQYTNPAYLKGVHTVYLNFGTLHMLHLHGVRNYSMDEKTKDTHGVDFIGALFLESWARHEITLYLKHVKNVVVMTPHKVCENVFHDDYTNWLKHYDESILNCVNWVMAQDPRLVYRNNTVWRQETIFGDVTQRENALKFCEATTFTGKGSENFRNRLLKTVEHLPNVQVVDAYKLTEQAGCNHTYDGIHYDHDIVLKELHMLQIIELAPKIKPVPAPVVVTKSDETHSPTIRPTRRPTSEPTLPPTKPFGYGERPSELKAAKATLPPARSSAREPSRPLPINPNRSANPKHGPHR